MISVATAAQPARPPLRRRMEHRLVAGVAGGLADWLNAPVAFIRVLLLVAMTASPWTGAAYALLALLLPARGQQRPGWDNLVGLGRLAILFAASFLFLGQIPLNGLFAQPPEAWIPRVGLVLVGAVAFFSSSYALANKREKVDARTTVLGAAPVAAFAAAIAAGLLLAPSFRWDRVVPLGVVLAAMALLLGLRHGHWRAFVAPALLAATAAGVAVGADVRLQGGIGDRQVAVASHEMRRPLPMWRYGGGGRGGRR